MSPFYVHKRCQKLLRPLTPTTLTPDTSVTQSIIEPPSTKKPFVAFSKAVQWLHHLAERLPRHSVFSRKKAWEGVGQISAAFCPATVLSGKFLPAVVSMGGGVAIHYRFQLRPLPGLLLKKNGLVSRRCKTYNLKCDRNRNGGGLRIFAVPAITKAEGPVIAGGKRFRRNAGARQDTLTNNVPTRPFLLARHN